MEKINSYAGLAENDYLYAKNSMDVGRAVGNFNVVASLCAQAAEKYLKSVIEKSFLDDPDVLNLLHTHNLRAIYNKIITKYTLTVSSKDCKWLGDFYYDARYPGDNFIVVNEDDANECIHIVEQIRGDIYSVLELIASQNEKARGEISKVKAFPGIHQDR